MPAIPLRRGDTLALRFTATSDGEPFAMNGWTVEAEMQFANCTPVALTASWITQSTGVGKLSLSSAQTEALPHIGEYILQVRSISPEGDATSATPVIIEVRD